jgi:multidrug transporter EmrE-like cation transporter
MLLFAVGISVAIVGSIATDLFLKLAVMEIEIPRLESFGGIQGLLNPQNLFEFISQSGILRNWKLLLSLVLGISHLGGFIVAMLEAPVTVVVPLISASSYIAATILDRTVFHERVTWLRWVGVTVVTIGAVKLLSAGGL